MAWASPSTERKRVDLTDDVSKPIVVLQPQKPQKFAREHNDLLLSERSNKGHRVMVRVEFSVYGRNGARALQFHRLHDQHMLVSAPYPNQARAAIKLIQRVCESLDGKFLVEEE